LYIKGARDIARKFIEAVLILQMEIKTSDKGGYRIVTLEGEFNLYTVRELKEAIFNSIITTDASIILDMKKVTYMDSNAIGVLYAAQKKLHDMNKELYVTSMNIELADVMRIVGIKFGNMDIDSLQ
jgi:anti-anti-sigma factor